MRRVLFICSQYRLRSPTAERVFSGRPDLQVISAGLNLDAARPITADLVEWADTIFVMEKAHRNRLLKRFRSQIKSRVICLDIPDEYEFMDPGLVRLLTVKVSRFLP